MESARFMIERNAIKKDNIGLKQLFRLKSSQYQWSAPIDLLEQYEEYLVSDLIFYNCTSPRFGPQCQYEFLAIRSHDLTLQEIFVDYYSTPSVPTGLTCYIHLDYTTN